MKLLSKIYVLLVLALMISSCHKDLDDKNIINKYTPNTVIFEEINGNVLGQVRGLVQNRPIPITNATVTIYDNTTKTDDNGVFHFKNIKLDKQGTYIKVEKSGYITASDVIYPNEGNTSYSHITMLEFDYKGRFKGRQGGEVLLTEGVKLSFPPNIIERNDGVNYGGTVSVSARVLKPGDKNFGDIMPGALRGEDETGKTVVLGTAGMIYVELKPFLHDEWDLKIKKGKKVKIEFDIPESDIAHSPDQIPLWHFDEDKGLWIEEGKAKLENGKYIGELPHFSWWNLDAKFDPIRMCSSVKYDNGKPGQNLIIQLEANVIYPVSYGWTDSEGQVCGLVPKDEEMILSVIDPFCYQVLYTTTIGPFGEDVTLDDIILPYEEVFGQGKVVCNGVPEPNAIVIIRNNCYSTIIPVDENGIFDLNQQVKKCDSSIICQINMFAYNPETGQASSNITLSLDGNDGEDIVLDLCADCDFEVNIVAEYGVQCDPSTITSLTAEVSGSGTYEYLWSNGATEATIANLESGLYCVTVTENNTDCEAVKCMEVNLNEGSLYLGEYYAFNPLCKQDNGSILLLPLGGLPPYKVSVTGPNGFTSESSDLKDLAAGVYIFTVEDDLGCTATQEVELQDVDLEVSIEDYQDPAVSIYGVLLVAYINSTDSTEYVGQENFNYTWSTGQSQRSITVAQSGTYCVTVTATEDCEFTGCIDVEIDTTIIDYVPKVTGCNGNIQYIDLLGEYELTTQTGMVYQVDSIFEMNVLVDGYSFDVNTPSIFFVPSIRGDRAIIVDEVVNTSCQTCNDGKINYHFDDSEVEYILGSEFGYITIYAEDNLSTDLSETNDKGELNSGTYYIVVHDKNTDCYIAHEKVIVE